MKTVNKIERAIILPVGRERVWSAITRPDQLSKWFAAQCELDFETGGALKLVWESGEVSRGVIEAIDPPTRFAFRWHAKPTDYTDPLVTFNLEVVEAGTQLTVTEEGFAALPASVRDHVLSENTIGWEDELQELAKFVTKAEPT
jgi:uncharacterized protein YndB with AHSA1/START domain